MKSKITIEAEKILGINSEQNESPEFIEKMDEAYPHFSFKNHQKIIEIFKLEGGLNWDRLSTEQKEKVVILLTETIGKIKEEEFNKGLDEGMKFVIKSQREERLNKRFKKLNHK